MIGLTNSSLKIFIALEPCDMRKSFNGLYDIATGHLSGELIVGLQRRLYGSKSERLDPNQEELEFTDELMGKPEASAGENGARLSLAGA